MEITDIIILGAYLLFGSGFTFEIIFRHPSNKDKRLIFKVLALIVFTPFWPFYYGQFMANN